MPSRSKRSVSALVDLFCFCSHHVEQENVPLGWGCVQQRVRGPPQHIHVILQDQCHVHTCPVGLQNSLHNALVSRACNAAVSSALWFSMLSFSIKRLQAWLEDHKKPCPSHYPTFGLGCVNSMYCRPCGTCYHVFDKHNVLEPGSPSDVTLLRQAA